MEKSNNLSLVDEINNLSYNYNQELETIHKKTFLDLESFKKKYDSKLKSIEENLNDKFKSIDISNLKDVKQELKDLYSKISKALNTKLKFIKKLITDNNDDFFNNILDKITDYITEATRDQTSSFKDFNDDKSFTDSVISDFDFYDPYNNQKLLPDFDISPIVNNQDSENMNFNSSSDYSFGKKKSVFMCTEHTSEIASHQCHRHCQKNFCYECFQKLGESSEHGKLIEIDKRINRGSTKVSPQTENFLNWTKKIFEIYAVKCNNLLNFDKIPDLPSFDNTNITELYYQKLFFEKVDELHKEFIVINQDYSKRLNEQIILMFKQITESKNVILQSAKIDINIFELIQKNSPFFITIFPHRYLNKKDEISKQIFPIIHEYSNEFDMNNIIDDKNVFLVANYFGEIKSYRTIHVVKENDIIKSINKLNEIYFLKSNFLNLIGEDNFEPKYDSILFNSKKNEMLSGEIYYPPNGWFSIGFKIPEDPRDITYWPVAYFAISAHMFGKKQEFLKILLEELIKYKRLDKLVINNFKEQFDKRYWDKVGNGIYLRPNIKIAENFTTTIPIGEKKYKILLMAKVKKDKIKEPKNGKNGFWIVDKDSIRIIRILFKEIN